MPRAFTRVQLLSATTSASHPADQPTARPFDLNRGAESSRLNISADAPLAIITHSQHTGRMQAKTKNQPRPA
jgi:hypothetical protein